LLLFDTFCLLFTITYDYHDVSVRLIQLLLLVIRRVLRVTVPVIIYDKRLLKALWFVWM